MTMPHVFLINLDRDEAKLARLRARLDELNIPFERFPAVYGKSLSEAEIKRWAPEPYFWLDRRLFALGEIGNVLSHRAILETIIARRLPYAVVLEDDVSIADDFPAILDRLPQHSQRFDMIKLESLHFKGAYSYRLLGSINGRDLILPRGVEYGCAGYFLTQKAAVKLLKAIPYVSEPFDHIINNFSKYDLRFAELYPNPIEQADALSEISVERMGLKEREPDRSYVRRLKRRKQWRRLQRDFYELRHLGLFRVLQPRIKVMRTHRDRGVQIAQSSQP